MYLIYTSIRFEHFTIIKYDRVVGVKVIGLASIVIYELSVRSSVGPNKKFLNWHLLLFHCSLPSLPRRTKQKTFKLTFTAFPLFPPPLPRRAKQKTFKLVLAAFPLSI